MTKHKDLNRLIAYSNIWSIYEALWVIESCRCTRREFCVGRIWTTPYALKHALDAESDETRYASELEVKFFGGPSGNDEVVGYLSMFAVDCALALWRKKGVSWKWLLRFNAQSDENIADQLGKCKPDFNAQKVFPGFEDERAGHYEEYAEGERVMEYVQVGDEIVPILESGRLGESQEILQK
jgi:hypothetical protein